MNITKHLLIINNEKKELSYKTVFQIEGAELKSMFDNIKYEWEPKENEIIYLFPQSNVDRKKLKSYCEKNGHTLTNTIEKATTCFAGPDNFKGSSKTVQMVHLNKVDYSYIQNERSFEIPDEILNDPELSRNVFIKNMRYTSSINDKFHTFFRAVLTNRTISPQVNRLLIYNTDLYTGEFPIYDDSCIIRLLNKGSIIDDQKMTAISRMIESSDPETKALAFKLILNCDFNSSALHLLLLLKKHGHHLCDMAPSRKAAFRSVLKYFGIERWELEYRLDNAKVVSIMKALNIYNSDSVKKLVAISELDLTNDLSVGLPEPIKEAGFINDSDEINLDCEF